MMLCAAALAAFTGSAYASPPSSQDRARSSIPAQTQADLQLKALNASAATAQSRLAAAPQDRVALIRAVKAGDGDAVRNLLIKSGFTAQQVDSSRLSVQDLTHGAPVSERVRVTITIHCCPPEIIITIEL
jgi:hypothetical protein